MAKLFGFKIPDGEDKQSKGVVSPVPPTDEDKSDFYVSSGFYGQYFICANSTTHISQWQLFPAIKRSFSTNRLSNCGIEIIFDPSICLEVGKIKG